MKYLLGTIMLCFVQSIASYSQNTVSLYTQYPDSTFNRFVQDSLKAFVLQSGMCWNVHQNASAIPAAITSTPGIALTTRHCTHVYSGKMYDLFSIKNFVRTHQRMDCAGDSLCFKNVQVARQGRMNTLIKTKITPVSGTRNQEDLALLKDSIQRIIDHSFDSFSYTQSACILTTDRIYYLDIHPYIQDKKWFMSYEVYSQFSCIKPILSHMDSPLISDNLKQTIRSLVDSVQTFLKFFAHLQGSERVTPVPTSTDYVSFPVVRQSEETDNIISTEAVPQRWNQPKAINQILPIISFAFAAPLQRYAGEIKVVDGNTKYDPTENQLTGDFEVNMQSLTMGMADLDQKVLSKYIKAIRFPKATLHFDIQNAFDRDSWSWGRISSMAFQAELGFMRKKKMVDVTSSFRPIIGPDGSPTLLVESSFIIELSFFNIKGPDGPKEASNQVVIDINLLLSPDFNR